MGIEIRIVPVLLEEGTDWEREELSFWEVTRMYK